MYVRGYREGTNKLDSFKNSCVNPLQRYYVYFSISSSDFVMSVVARVNIFTCLIFLQQIDISKHFLLLYIYVNKVNKSFTCCLLQCCDFIPHKTASLQFYRFACLYIYICICICFQTDLFTQAHFTAWRLSDTPCAQQMEFWCSTFTLTSGCITGLIYCGLWKCNWSTHSVHLRVISFHFNASHTYDHWIFALNSR